MNDSLGDCQSHRADRSIFSAEKIQDRWFKVSAAASVGAFALQRCPPDTRTLPPQPKMNTHLFGGCSFFIVEIIYEPTTEGYEPEGSNPI